MTAKRESDLSITSMIIDRIGRYEVLLPVNHSDYSFRKIEKKKQIRLRQTSPDGIMSKIKNLENYPVFFFRVSCCCYGYCDQFCDLVDLANWT